MADPWTKTADTEVVGAWLKLWNGDYSQADALIASDFRMHAAMLDGGDGSAVNGPQALVYWIGQTRAAIPDLQFNVQIGPIIEGNRIALRWSAQGAYQGGFPGAAAPPGTAVAFTGADFLRVEDGRVVEYWVNSDTLLLVTQLRVGAR